MSAIFSSAALADLNTKTNSDSSASFFSRNNLKARKYFNVDVSFITKEWHKPLVIFSNEKNIMQRQNNTKEAFLNVNVFIEVV